MKKLAIVLFLTLTAFGQNLKSQDINNKDDRYVGVYEYVCPGNTQDLIENHFIVLSEKGDVLSGLYYGTSDEFYPAREGFLPGFFVSPMVNLKINGDTIRFVLNTKNSDFLTQSVNLKIKSTKEAISSGYKNWGNKITTSPKAYVGLIKDSKTIFFKGENRYSDKSFIKRK
jgi:hypothetical protein